MTMSSVFSLTFCMFSARLWPEARPCQRRFLARDSLARYMLSPVRLSVRHIGGSVKNG